MENIQLWCYCLINNDMSRPCASLLLLHKTFRCCYCTTKTTIGFSQQMNNIVPPKEYKWIPGNLINENFTLGNGHVCLVLNREINLPPNVVRQLWTNAKIRCAVDGGSNHWREYVLRHFTTTADASGHIQPPDVITGDFDSITRETVEFFSSTPKIHTPDQNSTDFTKAIGVLQPAMTQRKVQDLVVFHDCSGRFDQIMASINTLYKTQKDKFNVYLLSGNSITWLLRPGKHTIQVPIELVSGQRWCSLIPVGEPARNVTTTGLKWNLYRGAMEFGGMVSTSNTYAAEFVQVETSSNLIWSMGAYEFSEETHKST